MPFFPKRLRSTGDRRQPRGVRPCLEALEERRVLAITYHGGPLLTHVAIAPVYLGQDWTSPSFAAQAGGLTNYLGFLAQSSYMDMLGEYGVGRGSLDGAGIFDRRVGSGQRVDDIAIQNFLLNDINAKLLQPPTANQLYVVLTAPNVVVTSAGQSSQQDFFGYHNVFEDTAGRHFHYAVIVHPVGNGDFYNLNDFQTLTKVASHEIAESVTDPGALTNLEGGGWYGPFSGFSDDQEIADVTEGQHDVGTLGTYTVQAVWSNKLQARQLPWNAKADPLSGSVELAPPDNLGALAGLLTHSSEAYANLVVQDYQHYLKRQPSAGEVQMWVGGMQAGVTEEQVLAAFIGSAEYYQRVGGTNQAWVEAMYHDLLGRPADSPGETSWLTGLARGIQRNQVAVLFATSAEAESLVVKNDYQRYLGRSASTNEINSWVSGFEAGVTNEQVVAGFLASLEYFFAPKKGQGTPAGWIGSAYADLFHRPASAAEINNWFQGMN